MEVVDTKRLAIAGVWTKSLERVENKGRSSRGDPTPGVLVQRVWKVLKTKGRRYGNVSRVRKVLKTRDEWIGAGSETRLGLTGYGMEEDCGARKLGGGARSMVYFTCWL